MYLHLSNNAPPKGRSRPFPCQLQSFLVFVFGGGPELCDTNPMKKTPLDLGLGQVNTKHPGWKNPWQKGGPVVNRNPANPLSWFPIPPTLPVFHPEQISNPEDQVPALLFPWKVHMVGPSPIHTHAHAHAGTCTDAHAHTCAGVHARTRMHTYMHMHRRTCSAVSAPC